MKTKNENLMVRKLLLIYLNVFMFNSHYADGSSINPFVVTFLLLAICIMVGEFICGWPRKLINHVNARKYKTTLLSGCRVVFHFFCSVCSVFTFP